MSNSKTVITPLGHHTKLSIKQCPKSEDEKKEMESTPCNALFIYLIILVEFRVFYMIYVDKCHVVVY